jgi:hypothetical protein
MKDPGGKEKKKLHNSFHAEVKKENQAGIYGKKNRHPFEWRFSSPDSC